MPPRRRWACPHIAADLGRREDVAALVGALPRPPAILVSSAGGVLGQVGRPVEEVPEDDWRAIFAANVDSAFFLAQALAPAMKAAGFGRIVTISSGAGLRASLTGIQAYAASKHALVGLTRQLASELGPHGITVNSVAPGFVLSNPASRAQWDSYGAGGTGRHPRPHPHPPPRPPRGHRRRRRLPLLGRCRMDHRPDPERRRRPRLRLKRPSGTPGRAPPRPRKPSRGPDCPSRPLRCPARTARPDRYGQLAEGHGHDVARHADRARQPVAGDAGADLDAPRGGLPADHPAASRPRRGPDAGRRGRRHGRAAGAALDRASPSLASRSCGASSPPSRTTSARRWATTRATACGWPTTTRSST